VATSGATRATPALGTMMSSLPCCFTAVATSASTWSGTRTSHATDVAPSSESATVFAAAASMSETTTLAPSAAKARATASPSPRPAPVTMATLSCNSFVFIENLRPLGPRCERLRAIGRS